MGVVGRTCLTLAGMLLGIGGSINLEHQSFSDNAHRVLNEIGADVDKLDAAWRAVGELV